MKKILALVVLLTGCVKNDPPPPSRFKEGDHVRIIVNNKMGIVLNVYYDNDCSVRYANDLGELKAEMVEEYELNPWEE